MNKWLPEILLPLSFLICLLFCLSIRPTAILACWLLFWSKLKCGFDKSCQVFYLNNRSIEWQGLFIGIFFCFVEERPLFQRQSRKLTEKKFHGSVVISRNRQEVMRIYSKMWRLISKAFYTIKEKHQIKLCHSI